LPEISPSRIELCGNTALAGCEYLLMDKTTLKKLEYLRNRVRFVNMADSLDFEDCFIENLYLKPMKRTFL
jgi:uncharacterized 2Fe-2S/4Fe-4S cluster protein (DUF4445 family)